MSKIHVCGESWLCEVCADAHPVEYVLTPEEGGSFLCDGCDTVQYHDNPNTHDKPTQEANDNG